MLNFFQLNTLELEQHLKNELEDNPLLEEGVEEPANDFDTADDNPLHTSAEDRTQDYMDWDEFRDDDVPDYKTRVNNYSDDDSSCACFGRGNLMATRVERTVPFIAPHRTATSFSRLYRRFSDR
ncbi:MAG: hypothetical protein R2822_04070 [Spirosomataceae bacterium]